MNDKIHEWIRTGIAFIAVILLFLVLVGGNQSVPFVGGSTSDDWNVGGNLTVTGTTNLTGAITATSAAFTSTLSAAATTLSGILKLDAGSYNSYVNSTSTADTTQTLALADISGYPRIIMTPTVGATTVTFPATSTLATFLPVAGDGMTQCWINGTSTASQTLTFAAGTGWDFDIAATSTVLTGTNETVASYAVPALGIACAEYTRMPATASTFDIKAAWTFYMKD